MTTWHNDPPTVEGWYYAKDMFGEIIVRVLKASNGELIGTNGNYSFALAHIKEWGPRIPTTEELASRPA